MYAYNARFLCKLMFVLAFSTERTKGGVHHLYDHRAHLRKGAAAGRSQMIQFPIGLSPLVGWWIKQDSSHLVDVAECDMAFL